MADENDETVSDEVHLGITERVAGVRHYAKRCPNRATARFIYDSLLSVVRVLEKDWGFEVELKR